ncbi:response regulator [Alteraurantiacibacter aquimixticola]|uniref:Response regulator n=1 Tax=Alteraurantiacibacter aquimixticola TaxID=2489173 RepID=A0A4V4U8S2_9SPHN|nr:response regulator [Alteraurantiacibacter aquimixticola]TIX51177.1 response regulator [Alteraurantiacibacter aquimixticola]
MASVKHKNPKSGTRNVRVLLVEDDPILSLDLEQALREAGANDVVICASMAATVAELERKAPDAIILDVHLADRDDGWALAEIVSMLGPKKPRIAFSTGSPQDIPPQVREMGCVFEKPYDPAQLADVLLNQKKTGFIARLRGALG